MVSYGAWGETIDLETGVLILVVMEDGLVLSIQMVKLSVSVSLNPCCSGRWSRTENGFMYECRHLCLNPCCSGRWSRTY
nr:hypothetical protein [Segatella copri]